MAKRRQTGITMANRKQTCILGFPGGKFSLYSFLRGGGNLSIYSFFRGENSVYTHFSGEKNEYGGKMSM